MVAVQPQTTPVAGDPTAVMGRRIVAALIDWGIGLALLVSLWLSVADSATFASSGQAERICDDIQNTSSSTACFAVGDQVWVASNSDTSMVVLVMLAYGVFFQLLLPGVAGYSIGKGIMGLRIVKHETGQLAGLGANAIRWILWVVDGVPCYLLPLVGFITGLASKGHRRVGDMAAGTVVVDKASVGSPLTIPGLSQTESEAPGAWSPPSVSPPPAPGGHTDPPSGPADVAPPPTPPPSPPQSAVPSQPPAFPPPSTPPLDSTPPPPGAPDATTAMPDLPSAEAAPPATPELPSAPTPEPEPEPPSQPGVDAPQWDQARNTYIQWDPELGQWMEWSENSGKWIPIST